MKVVDINLKIIKINAKAIIPKKPTRSLLKNGLENRLWRSLLIRLAAGCQLSSTTGQKSKISPKTTMILLRESRFKGISGG